MSSKIKLDLSDYYDEVINKIDIQTEIQLLDKRLSSLVKNKINNKRKLFLNKINSIKNAILNKLEAENVMNQLISDEKKFLFYIRPVVLRPKLNIGQLVEINRYISQEILTLLNFFVDILEEDLTVEISNLDTNNLQAIVILASILLAKSKEIVSIDYNLSKIENLFLGSTGCNLLVYDEFGFLKFKQIRSIDLTSLDNLKNLYIYDQSIEKLFSNSISSISLKELELSFNEIEKLDQNFVDCPNLIKIDLSHNKIKCLNKEVFNGLTSLEYLNLEQNLIENLDEEVFSKLVNLKDLDLSDNQIELISEFAFNGLEKLETVSLVRNDIRSIDRTTFEKLPNLTHLNLDFNQLKVFECKLPNIKELDLLGNFFESIDLSRYHTLETICLGRNTIHDLSLKGLKNLKNFQYKDSYSTKLKENLFENSQNLIKLDLSINRLKSLNGVLRNLSCLEVLDLHSNELSDLTGCFRGLKNLKFLKLINNKIVRINIDDFKDLTQLVDLNLKQNLIDYVADGAFNNLNKLQTLNLSNNKIKSLGELKNLEYKIDNLDLSNNPLDS